MKQVTFRAPTRMREKMDRAAAREHRSRSNWIRKVLREAIEEEDQNDEEAHALN